jgi:phage head maturation protease
MKLIEVSIVTVPAYKDTSVEVGQRAQDLKKFKELEQLKTMLDIESLRFET